MLTLATMEKPGKSDRLDSDDTYTYPAAMTIVRKVRVLHRGVAGPEKCSSVKLNNIHSTDRLIQAKAFASVRQNISQRKNLVIRLLSHEEGTTNAARLVLL